MRLKKISALVVMTLFFLVFWGCGPGGNTEYTRVLMVDLMDPAGGSSLPVEKEGPPAQNQTITVVFTSVPVWEAIMDPSQPNGLTSNLTILNQDTARVGGKPFLGGKDVHGNPAPDFLKAMDPENPGMEMEIRDDKPYVFRFVADLDDDLSTYEPFFSDTLFEPEKDRRGQITVKANKGLTNYDGDVLAEEFGASFSIGVDKFRPVLSAVVPANNATNVPRDTEIYLYFSETVDQDTVFAPQAYDSKNNPLPPFTFKCETVLSGLYNPSVPGIVRPISERNKTAYVFTPIDLATGAATKLPAGRIIVQCTLSDQYTSAVQDLALNFLDDQDRSNDPKNEIIWQFMTEPGPQVANAPVSPQTLYFGTFYPATIGVLDVRWDVVVTDSQNQDPPIGQPLDIEVGNCMAPGNLVSNPPLPNPPEPPGSPPVAGYSPDLPAPSIPIGNFLFVADGDNNVVQVLNSNTVQPIYTFSTPDPTGLGLVPDLSFLFVSNFKTGTVSVVDLQGSSQTYWQVVKDFEVGAGPRGICANPNSGWSEVFVCNSLDDSVTILDWYNLHGQAVVGNFTSFVGPEPYEVAVTTYVPVLYGGTDSFFAFVTNRQGNSVSVYEGGPQTILGINTFVDRITGFDTPMGITADSTRAYSVFLCCNGSDEVKEFGLSGWINQGTFQGGYWTRTNLRFYKTFINIPVGQGPFDVTLMDVLWAWGYPLVNTKYYHWSWNPPIWDNAPSRFGYTSCFAEGQIYKFDTVTGFTSKTISIEGGPAPIQTFWDY